MPLNHIQKTILIALGYGSEVEKQTLIRLVLSADRRWRKSAVEKRLKQFRKMRLITKREDIEITVEKAERKEYFQLTPKGRQIFSCFDVFSDIRHLMEV